jgi:two-component system KDP operon response regulator KdpE
MREQPGRNTSHSRRALLRLRPEPEEADFRASVVSRRLCLDFNRRIITVRGKSVHLTPREFELLRELVAHHGTLLSHKRLLAVVLGPNSNDGIEWLRVLVSQLRKKIELHPDRPQYIQTEPCIGYRFVLPAGARVRSSHE